VGLAKCFVLGKEVSWNQLISPEDLYTQLSGENPPPVIDVRGEEAYQAGHIMGALHIPADDIGVSLAQIPRDRPVVTY
jgi:rhodanese-related sulfurtransferase